MQARHDRIGDAVASVVDDYWRRLAKAIADQHDPQALIVASRLAYQQMVKDLKASFAKNLTGLMEYSQERAINTLMQALPKRLLGSWAEETLGVHAKKKISKRSSSAHGRSIRERSSPASSVTLPDSATPSESPTRSPPSGGQARRPRKSPQPSGQRSTASNRQLSGSSGTRANTQQRCKT